MGGRTTSKSHRTNSARKKVSGRRSRSPRAAAKRTVVLRTRNRSLTMAEPASADSPLDAILSRIIAVETGSAGDGYVNRVADRGGATMRGVTLPSCAEFVGHAVSAEEMRQMFRCTKGQVDCRDCEGCNRLRQFYRAQYVERFHFDRIADPQLQALMVDWAVTSSGIRPVKALQRALGLPADACDGVFGAGTQRALTQVGSTRELYVKVLKARSEFYIDVALNDPKVKAFMRANPDVQLHNLRGWNRERVLAFLA